MPFTRGSPLSGQPLLARALDVPGAILDALGGSARPFPRSPEVDLLHADSLTTVAASPRANAYLSLERGLVPLKVGEGLLAVATTRRHAFAVGGIHLDPAVRLGDVQVEAATIELLSAFRSSAEAAGYRRALLFPVDDIELRAVHQAGFDTLQVGAEAHIDLSTYDLNGRRHADLRQMLNRAAKRYRLTVAELSASEAEAAATSTVARWLASRPLHSRMRLLVGSACFDRPAHRRYFACFAPDSADAVALITVTPGWNGKGAGLDVMARAPGAPAGAMELLVHHAMTTLTAEGATHFSLGACPMSVGAAVPASSLRHRLLLRVFRAIYRSRMMNRLFRFRSLVHFKSKFDPTWRSVHIAAWPRVSAGALYAGCRMWGLFGSDPCLPPPELDA